MGLFDFLKKKIDKEPRLTETVVPQLPAYTGKATAEKIELEVSNIEILRRKFIAFDVETTGLNPATDRIVEIGAVLFSDGNPVQLFSTLINPGIAIPESATSVNHITNTMLSSAPSESDIYPRLINFLGGALHGEVIMCAHNARFDFDILCNTLSRFGYDANIRYADTLSLSRKYIKGLENYKQSTLEAHLGLTNLASHRAASDATNCGKILWSILDYIEDAKEREKKQVEQLPPEGEELDVCAYIQNIIAEQGGDTSWLRFQRNSGNYVAVTCLYSFIKFKFAKKGRYILVRQKNIPKLDLPVEPCSESEGGTEFVRVYFSSPFDLKPLSRYIYSEYKSCYNSMQEYISRGSHEKQEVLSSICLWCALSKTEIESLLEDVRHREYVPAVDSVKVDMAVSREKVVINAVHNRVSIDEIKNQNDWNKGFEAGFPYWERGEDARKNGKIDEAIELFDKARYNGYDAPALYNSYALAYRQIKDYENEIIILDEGILRMPENSSLLEARREKAIKLLYAQQEADRKAEGKMKAQAEREVKKVAVVSEPKKPRGRVILQLADDGTVIKEFESISAAVQEIGVSSKSIRDAANGVQKHAGGYRWMYKE